MMVQPHYYPHWWGRKQEFRVNPTALSYIHSLRTPRGPWTPLLKPTTGVFSPSSHLWLIVCPACHALSFFINIDYNCPAVMEDFNIEPFTPTVTKAFEGIPSCIAVTTWEQPALCKASVWLNVQSSTLSILLKGRIIDCIDYWSVLACMLCCDSIQKSPSVLVNVKTTQHRCFSCSWVIRVIYLPHILRSLSYLKLAKAFV